MSSRNLLNILLLLGAAALAATAWYRPGKAPPKAPQTLTGLKPGQIHQVRITRADHPPIVLRKRDSHWYLEGKPELPAAQFAVASILRLADQKATRSYPAGQLDPAKLKLDKPRITVTFNDGPAIAFGTTEPLEHQRYVQVNGKIHLIHDEVERLVETGRTGFVSRRLLPLNATLDALDLPDLKLERDKQGNWKVHPAHKKASADDLQALADAWTAASALTVSRYQPGKDGRSHGTVKVTFKHHAAVQFTIVHRKPELVLGRADLGLAYHMGSDAAGRLLSLRPVAGGSKDQPAGSAEGRPSPPPAQAPDPGR